MSSSSFYYNPRKRTRLEGTNYAAGGVRPLTLDMGPATTYRIGTRPRIRPFRKGFNRTGGYYGRFGRGGELKFLDTAIAIGNIIPGTGGFSPTLVAIPQDDTESGRDGRQAIVKQLSIRGAITTDATAVNQERLRFVLVQDTQTNGALATILNVLETNDINSFRNLENNHRFKILKDIEIPMPPKTVNTAATTAMVQTVPFKCDLKMNMIMDYDSSAATGVIATQRSNGLFFFLLSGGSSTADFGGIARIRFADK